MIKDRLKELRTNAGYTLEDMGKVLGVSAGTVQRYESPQGIKNIPYDTMLKYAAEFHVDPGYLFGGAASIPEEIIEIDAVDDVPVVKPRKHIKLNHTPKRKQYTISAKSLEIADRYEKADDMTKGMVDRILGIEKEE